MMCTLTILHITWYDVRMKRRADCPICHEKVGLPGEKIVCVWGVININVSILMF